MMHKGVSYATFGVSQEDSFIEFKTGSTSIQNFGSIFPIFIHCRSPTPTLAENQLETWLHVQRFPSIPKSMKAFDPFRHSEGFHAQTYLRAWGPTQDCIVRLGEIVAHCSWVIFKPAEVNSEISIPTVGLVSMNR